jgi:electron transfer flavoprotein alpha/beta subunit
MNIIVCTKAVPGFIKNPVVAENHEKIEYEAGSIVINESDDYALEAGVKLAKKTGGKTTVVTAGTLSSQKVLQAGMGKDADGAVRVDTSQADTAKIARILSATIKDLEYDLIVTGVESSDNMASQVGVSMAEQLGIPFAFAVLEMAPGETDATVRITKELGFGKTQIEEIELPALVCFQTGSEPPSFVPVRKMMMAQRKPIKTVAAKDLGLGDEPAPVKILDVFTPKELSMAEMIEGAPKDQAARVMGKIREVI